MRILAKYLDYLLYILFAIIWITCFNHNTN